MHSGKYLKQSKLVQAAKVGSGHQTVTIASEKVKKKQSNVA